MLTAVKRQFKITKLSIKYALMRELLNKVTFFSNIIFMILNNASFLIQWIVLYSLKENFGGYSFKQVLLLWAITATTYGFSHFFTKDAYRLSELINEGKLDAFLVQPKSVLIGAITANVEVSAIGDLLYGYIVLFIAGCDIKTFLLFNFFSITGAIILTSFAVILGSLSFWFKKTDVLVDNGQRIVTSFSTYPEGIFKSVVKWFLYIAVPVGITSYIPIKIFTTFNLKLTMIIIVYTIAITLLAIFIFNKGLKRYSSTNLMESRY